MWTQDGALLLLLAGCLWSAEAQSQSGTNIWDTPIKFKTKAKDECTMIITGRGQHTWLRLSCQSSSRSYWCEYVGTPYICRNYNKNPRHYFTQMSWGLRKLQNACQAPKQIKPQMCKKAHIDSQMVFSSASFSRKGPRASSRTKPRPKPASTDTTPAPTSQNIQSSAQAKTTPKPTTKPTSPDTTPGPTTPNITPSPQSSAQVTTTPTPSPEPTTAPEDSKANKTAEQYCWKSFQGVCSFFIGLFQK